MKRIVFTLGLLFLWASCSYAQIPNVKMQSQCIGNDVNTLLLVHFNGVNASTTIPDSSLVARGNATVNGSAQLSTATSRFGSASGSFGAAGNYISFPASSAWQLGTADFTIDLWAQLTTTSDAVVFSLGGASPQGFLVEARSTAVGFSGAFNGSSYLFSRFSTTSLTTSTWHHLAFVRSGGTFFNFVNGASQSFSSSVGAVTLNLGPSSLQPFNIGGQSVIAPPLMDELRISNIARWTSDFNPPSVPYCP